MDVIYSYWCQNSDIVPHDHTKTYADAEKKANSSTAIPAYMRACVLYVPYYILIYAIYRTEGFIVE